MPIEAVTYDIFLDIFLHTLYSFIVMFNVMEFPYYRETTKPSILKKKPLRVKKLKAAALLLTVTEH